MMLAPPIPFFPGSLLSELLEVIVGISVMGERKEKGWNRCGDGMFYGTETLGKVLESSEFSITGGIPFSFFFILVYMSASCMLYGQTLPPIEVLSLLTILPVFKNSTCI